MSFFPLTFSLAFHFSWVIWKSKEADLCVWIFSQFSVSQYYIVVLENIIILKEMGWSSPLPFHTLQETVNGPPPPSRGAYIVGKAKKYLGSIAYNILLVDIKSWQFCHSPLWQLFVLPYPSVYFMFTHVLII